MASVGRLEHPAAGVPLRLHPHKRLAGNAHHALHRHVDCLFVLLHDHLGLAAHAVLDLARAALNQHLCGILLEVLVHPAALVVGHRCDL